MQDGFRLKS